MTIGHAAKGLLMGVVLLLCCAGLFMLWIVGGALAFVVGRWCAQLLGWY